MVLEMVPRGHVIGRLIGYELVDGWGLWLPDIVSSIYKYQMGIIGRSINLMS